MSRDSLFLNELGQPIGATVPNWKPVSRVFGEILQGRYCHLTKLDPSQHEKRLYQAYLNDPEGRLWTYLPYGPFADEQEFLTWLQVFCTREEPFFYVIENQNELYGLASYMRIDPQNGSIEIGHLAFSPALQRTRMATEAIYLLLNQVFSMGYRRVEWKCNALNAASVSAALRLGMTFEGIFRQAAVIKGRNRDTAWYSMLDEEWKIYRSAYECWLSDDNFDEAGQQKKSLQTFLQSPRENLKR